MLSVSAGVLSSDLKSIPSAFIPQDSGSSRIKTSANNENPKPPTRARIHKVSLHPKKPIKLARNNGAKEKPKLTNTFLIPPTNPLFFTNQSNKTFLEQLVNTPCPKNRTPK